MIADEQWDSETWIECDAYGKPNRFIVPILHLAGLAVFVAPIGNDFEWYE
jgi:hypothetical protein